MGNDLYGMDSFPLTLDDVEFIIFSAQTVEARRAGLSELDTLDENEGMLLTFPVEAPHQIWMKDTNFPLDIIFLDENMEILLVAEGKPNDETLITGPDNTYHVLELPLGTAEGKLEAGDRIDGIPEEYRKSEDDQEATPLKVLGEGGEVQAELAGGERIFSRESTKKMIKLAKTAESDDELMKLAKVVLEELIQQDERPVEHIDEDSVQYQKNEDGTVKKV